jgi:hypothetical protein
MEGSYRAKRPRALFKTYSCHLPLSPIGEPVCARPNAIAPLYFKRTVLIS